MPDQPSPSARAFAVDEQRRDGTVTLVLTGDLDHAAARHLDRRVARATAGGAESILIDLSGITLLDSSGLRSLLFASLAADAGGPSLRLILPPEHLRRRIRVTGLDRRLPFVE